MKKLLVGVWLVLLLLVTGTLFWYNQYRYSLPTPVPAHYTPVKNGTAIRLTKGLNMDKSKPVFLHFFNPDCPCSRFNLQHVKSLIKQYSRQASFAVVLVTSKPYTARQIQQKFDLAVPVVSSATLAAACGVYATPQAVILTPAHQLYYRGNYNSSRYCTNKKTEYARQALESMLHRLPLMPNSAAQKAYGCQLAQNLNTTTL
jgi:hypothetical protein